MSYPKPLSPEQALEKARHYCAYQERSHSEVREKLYSLGLHRAGVESLLSALIEEDYLNEERFARAFAGGHFRTKQWGRIKIRQALIRKKVSEYNIRTALRFIDEADYLSTLEKLALRKWKSISGPGTNNYVRRAKTSNYLIQKGYEPELVGRAIRKISGQS